MNTPNNMNWTSFLAQIQKAGPVSLVLFLVLYILFQMYQDLQQQKNACYEKIIEIYQEDKKLDREERKALKETLKDISELLKKNGS